MFYNSQTLRSTIKTTPPETLTQGALLMRISALVVTFPLAVCAQQQASPPQPASTAETAAAVAKANNPLASMNAINLQDYYDPSLYSIPNAVGNTMMLRGAIVAGRQIIRGTLPVSTLPSGYGIYDLQPAPSPFGIHVGQTGPLDAPPAPVVSIEYASGLGDFNIFDMIKLNSDSARTEYALGPLFVAPTATDRALGAGKWQAGLSGVVIHPLPMGSLVGTLMTWQHSFAGHSDRSDTNFFTCQTLGTFGIGGGYYIRSSGDMTFDEDNARYLIPLGVGAGKVFKAGSATGNAFIEPQFTIYHQGIGQPTLQVFAGINLQWAKKSK
jgi:hypothetical protein